MRQTTQDKNIGIRWNLFTNPDYLDIADDLALLSHTHSRPHIQEKTNRLHTYAKQVGLLRSTRGDRSNDSKFSRSCPSKSRGRSLAIHRPIHIQCILVVLLDTTEEQEATSATELVRPGMPSGCLAPLWKLQQYMTHTRLNLNKSCILSTILYASECWRMIEKDLSKLSFFHTKNLRKLLGSCGHK